jgi:hypothetical protein
MAVRINSITLPKHVKNRVHLAGQAPAIERLAAFLGRPVSTEAGQHGGLSG